jgi:hypothetical protein
MHVQNYQDRSSVQHISYIAFFLQIKQRYCSDGGVVAVV